jgi:NAD(P)-dependent dehydrogenase (short-subunit alcohol dehydrogenase family)
MGQTVATGPVAGKTCIVTGANSGLGLATVKRLAAMNAHVICTVRDDEKGKNTINEIKKTNPDSKADYMLLNLDSFQSVRDFVSDFQKRYSNLHILINNAGVRDIPQFEQTEDGYEHTFQVNYLSPFLLTNLLIDQMIQSVPDKNVKGFARIVNITSASQKFARNPDILLNDSEWNSKEKYNQGIAYCYSKLALALYTTQLHRNLQQYKDNTGFLTVNAVNPGGMTTNFFRHLEHDKLWLIRLFTTLRMLSSPEIAVKYPLYVATSPETSNISGNYINGTKIRPAILMPNLDKISQELWERTRIWTRNKAKNVTQTKNEI